MICFRRPASEKLASHQRLESKRVGRGLLPQRAFGGAFTVVGERALRRAQYAAIRPIGGTVLQSAFMVAEPLRPIGQAAFDAAIGVGSGKHGRGSGLLVLICRRLI
ncbi:hypothetical protein ASD99_12440 [Mesorhizobium sp. Root695]|nr:hypothetical protein ASD12_01495 [Mesorhizobium sp. Root102]KRB15021.1 hypothetical protein ASD99_12440 [Mesorhizobium sp. Root695]